MNDHIKHQGHGSRRALVPIAFRQARLCAILLVWCSFFACQGFAHPASGIVVDDHGRVYFLYHGLVRIEPSGALTTIQENSGGHWLTLDSKERIGAIPLSAYRQVLVNGNSMWFGDGAPLAMGADGTLYYGSSGSQNENLDTGALTVAKLTPRGARTLFSPRLEGTLAKVRDGVTGLAVGADGFVYVATWKGFVKLNQDGSIVKFVNPVAVEDCDHDPADHNPANAASPLFRGIGADSAGNVYLAATSCHRVLKIAPDGGVRIVLKTERPWSPTGLVVSGSEVYVLEYTNANGPRTEGWYPRVRRVRNDGTWQTLATVEPPASSGKDNLE